MSQFFLKAEPTRRLSFARCIPTQELAVLALMGFSHETYELETALATSFDRLLEIGD